MTGSVVFDASVRILGRSEITVENVCGLCELGKSCVTFRTKSGGIEIRGEELVIVEAREGSFSINGRVDSVVYL